MNTIEKGKQEKIFNYTISWFENGMRVSKSLKLYNKAMTDRERDIIKSLLQNKDIQFDAGIKTTNPILSKDVVNKKTITIEEVEFATKLQIREIIGLVDLTITPESNLREDLKMDSLLIVDLIFNLECMFKVEVKDYKYEKLKTVNDVVMCIHKLL